MTWRLACSIGAVLIAGSASAQATDRPVPAVHRPSPVDATPLPMLSEAELGASRAGRSTVTGTQTLTAVTTGNTINGDPVAGPITLSGNALSRFSGVGNFAINTGSQVSIQSAMNLTVNVTN